MSKSTLTKKVLSKYINPYFVETGTQFGYALEVAIESGFKKLISIELDSNLQEQNFKKFQSLPDSYKLQLVVGDSLVELDKIIQELTEPATFWLDAHAQRNTETGPAVIGIKKCPLYEELDSISKSAIKTHTIMIDDLRLIGTGGWGVGMSLDLMKQKILSINANYTITLEDGHVKNDILVAHI